MKASRSVPHRIHSLDGFRGMFALLVMLYHANNNTVLTDNFLIRQSSLFVDYFFVLSGFVISYSYEQKIFDFYSLRNFIKKRVFRLYPLLLYTTLAYLLFMLVGKCFNLVNSPNNLWLDTIDTLTFLNSTPLLGSTMGMNYPSWSISSEMISYTFFGLSLFLFRKNAFVVMAITCLLFLLFVTVDHYSSFGHVPFIRGAFCFYLGYFVFSLSKGKAGNGFGTLTEVAYLLILLVTFKVTGEHKDGLTDLVYPFLFSLGIFLFVRSKGIIHRLLNSTPFQFLGKISYSIYLNHAFVLVVVEKLLFSLFHFSKTSFFANVLYLLLSLFFVLVYSNFTYKYIEVGVDRRIKKFVSHKSRSTKGVVMQLEAIG